MRRSVRGAVCVVEGEDQVGHHLPQQDGTLVILPIAETHGDQCAEPDELVKYVHPSFLLIKNAAHPVGCVAKNGGDAQKNPHLFWSFIIPWDSRICQLRQRTTSKSHGLLEASVIVHRFCCLGISIFCSLLPFLSFRTLLFKISFYWQAIEKGLKLTIFGMCQ